jgi:type IV pilus assembly protein PilM
VRLYKRVLRSNSLGIDITPNSINLLELSCSNKKYIVENYSRIETSIEIIKNGVLQNLDVIVDSLQLLIKQTRPKCNSVALAIPDSSTISKTIPISYKLNSDDIEQLVSLEVDKLISYPLSEISYDYKLLGPSKSLDNMLDLLIVASRFENIKQRIEMFKKLGLKISSINIESNAVLKAIKYMTNFALIKKVQTIALMEIGELYSKIYVFHLQECIFCNEEAFGTINFASNNLSFVDFIAGINRVLKFYYSINFAKNIDLFIVTGSGAQYVGLFDFIKYNLNIEMLLVNPFNNIEIFKNNVCDKIMQDYLILTTAFGLALN